MNVKNGLDKLYEYFDNYVLPYLGKAYVGSQRWKALAHLEYMKTMKDGGADIKREVDRNEQSLFKDELTLLTHLERAKKTTEEDRIKIFETTDVFVLPEDGKQGFMKRAQYAELVRSNEKASNLLDIYSKAATELKGTNVPNNDVDRDWAAKFSNYAQDVTSEELKKMWSKLLAGKIKGPNNVSTHTMAVLSTMGKEDAELFRRFTRYILVRGLTIGNNTMGAFNETGIPGYPEYEEIMLLVSLGLFHDSENTHMKIRMSKKTPTFLARPDYFFRIMANNVREQEVKIPVWPMTRSGIELLEVIDEPFEVNFIQMYEKYLNSLLEKNGGVRIDFCKRHGLDSDVDFSSLEWHPISEYPESVKNVRA